MPARSKSQFTACFEQLSHVKTGLESHLSENPNLAGMDPYADKVCDQILSGFQKPAECKGQVKTRVETVCDNFNVKILPDPKGALTKYQITANAKDRHTCGICITEEKGYPEKYDDCTATVNCPSPKK